MAKSSLQDVLLKGTGSGNVLGKTSDEELQNLAKKHKVPTPTDPASASAIGASPDSSKMAGSSANLKSTIQQVSPTSGEAPASLRDTLRHQQSRKQLTAAEQQQQQMQEMMQSGGANFTSDAAGAAAQSAFTGMPVEKAELKLKEEFSWIGDDEKATENVAKLLTGGGGVDYTALAAMEGPDGNKFATWGMSQDELVDKVKGVFGDTSSQVAQASADAVIDYDEFGIEAIYGEDSEAEIQELAQSLGIEVEELQGMNMNQIQDALTATIQEEYSRTENLLDQATDITLSPAERAEARKLAKDMGAVGVASMEISDVDQLADQMMEADTVNIGEGDDVESISVEDLLKDELITGMVANYLAGDEQAEAQLAKRGDLLDFVKKNRTAFDSLVQGVDTSVTSWAKVQTHNKEEEADATTIFGDDIAALLAKEGFEGLSGFSNTEVNIAALDSEQARNTIQGLSNSGLKTDIGMMDELKIAEHFDDLKEDDRINFVDSSKFADDVAASGGDLNKIYGPDEMKKIEEGKAKFATAETLNQLGFDVNIPEAMRETVGILNSKNEEGEANWSEAIKSKVATGIEDLKDGDNYTKDGVLASMTNDYDMYAGNDIARKLSEPGMLEGGKVSESGIDAIVEIGPNADEINKLFDKGVFGDPDKALEKLGPALLEGENLRKLINNSTQQDIESLREESNPAFANWEGQHGTVGANYHGGGWTGHNKIRDRVKKVAGAIGGLEKNLVGASGVERRVLAKFIEELKANHQQMKNGYRAYRANMDGTDLHLLNDPEYN